MAHLGADLASGIAVAIRASALMSRAIADFDRAAEFGDRTAAERARVEAIEALEARFDAVAGCHARLKAEECRGASPRS